MLGLNIPVILIESRLKLLTLDLWSLYHQDEEMGDAAGVQQLNNGIDDDSDWDKPDDGFILKALYYLPMGSLIVVAFPSADFHWPSQCTWAASYQADLGQFHVMASEAVACDGVLGEGQSNW